MSEMSLGFVGFPREIVEHVVRYLFGTDEKSFFRLCISSTGAHQEAIQMLDHVVSSFQPGASFDGARPVSVVIRGWPQSPQATEELASWLPSTRTLGVLVDSPCTNNEIRSFGRLFNQMDDVEYSVPSSEDDTAPLLLSWVTHLTNLRSLRLSWSKYIDIILDEVTSGLIVLELRSHPLSRFRSMNLDSLRGCLHKFTALESLILDASILEVSDILQATRNETQMGAALDALCAILPSHLRTLKNLFIRISDPRGAYIVPASGYFFVKAAPQTRSVFLTRLRNSGINDIGCELGISSLCFAILSPTCEVSQIQALVSAGADISQRMRLSTAPLFGSTGSILHVALACAHPDVMDELLHHVDPKHWQSDPDILRTSSGFTPLHFIPKHSESWLKLFQQMRAVFPGCHRDSDNLDRLTPLESIHSNPLDATNVDAVIKIARFLLAHTDALSFVRPDFVGRCLAFYGSAVLTDEGLVENICALFVDLWQFVLSRPADHRALYLDFPVTIDLASFALAYHEPLFRHLSEGRGPDFASRCLLRSCAICVCLLRLPVILPVLVRAGADVNFTDPSLHDGQSALCILMNVGIRRTIPSASFWRNLWHLVDQGASFMVLGQRQPVTAFITPAVLRTASSADVERLSKWSLTHSAEGLANSLDDLQSSLPQRSQ